MILSNLALLLTLAASPPPMDWIRIDPAGKGFVLAGSGKPFFPWGHNYAAHKRLIEEYWGSDWATVVRDFEAMRRMGSNVVRIHLQFGAFVDALGKANEKSLKQLEKLLELAQRTGLYLDITGLACFRKSATPAWYDALGEAERWQAQAFFWEVVAKRCAESPAVFCYDLMNEPIVPGQKRKAGEWMSGKPLGDLDFVQFVALDPAGRDRADVAREWIKTLSAGIRKHDKRHLITVGMLPSTPKWGFLSGFIPVKVAPEMDFVCVHVYPETGKPAEALKVVKDFAVGKPLVIEETFPMSCSVGELKEFLLASRGQAVGWVGHYLGETPEELAKLREEKKLTFPQAASLAWFDLFKELGPQMTDAKP